MQASISSVLPVLQHLHLCEQPSTYPCIPLHIYVQWQGSFVGSLWVAAILCLVRVGGIWGGCWLGCWLGGTPADHRRQMWYGMITQVRPHYADLHVTCIAATA